ncbi:Golgi to ER traffic protein 2 [Nakaseomyces bracarensis]|uniref:Golgi to ER traffic protein 2 n=1 Tax=Nakaseomyces bracarensis TaxID=273131 RepID=A0ABR4NW53_9SACH
MSEISEAEKRRILRERRQQKFSNGGATTRLNKIVNKTGSQLSTESPMEAKKEETPAEQVKTQRSEQVVKENPTSDKSHLDPQVELFKQLADMKDNDGSAPDLFSLMKGLGQNGEDSPFPMGAPQVQDPIDPEMLAYHKYRINALKAKTIFMKWVFFFFPYLYLLTRTDGSYFPFLVNSYLPESLTSRSSFFSVFVTFEIIATSIYYQLYLAIERDTNIKTLQDTSKIVNLVSLVPEGILPITNLRGKVIMALKYLDVVNMMVTDVCFVLVAIGLVSQI